MHPNGWSLKDKERGWKEEVRSYRLTLKIGNYNKLQAGCDFLKFKILFRIQKIRFCSLRRIIQFGASWNCHLFKTFQWEFSRSAQSGSKDLVKI